MTEVTRRRGRRPAGEDARAEILTAARAEFAARGFEGTTLRGIARAAGVDPRLVHHYFEGKEDVFVEAFDFPARPADLVPAIFGPGIDGVGERMLRFFFGVWDTPRGRETMLGVMRAAATSEQASGMLREFVTQAILSRAADVVPGPDARLRVEIAVAHLLGIALARYVIAVEPLASADLEDLMPIVAPALQRYLSGP